MPKLDNFFSNNKSEKIEQILTKKMHPQLISIKKLEESKLQYRDIPQEDTERLADLIELDGEVLQPLLVRKSGADTYEILAGHKRFRACKLLSSKGLEQFSLVPCYVKTMSDAQAEFAVYSTNGYNRKTDYEIMREVEGMSRLLKENPELFPEAASGRLVEKLAKIMNMSKTTVQEYKTISNNLSDEAMEKFKNNEITKESAKTLAGLSSEEQRNVIATGVTETKEIKEAVRIIRNPSMSEIKSAFNAMYNDTIYPANVVNRYSSLEECFKDKEGRTHSWHNEYKLSYECSLRGIKINNRKEITWHEFVTAAIEMGLYNSDDVYNKPSDTDIKMAYSNLTYKAELKNYTSGKLLENYMKDTYRHREYLSSTLTYSCSYRGITINHREEITWHEFVMASLRMGLYTFEDNNCDKAEEQIQGQDDIYNYPEYLPDDKADSNSSDKAYSEENNINNENSCRNVTDSVTENEKESKKVCYIQNSDRITGVKKIGNCPYCNAPLIYISNKNFCGKCGKKINW